MTPATDLMRLKRRLRYRLLRLRLLLEQPELQSDSQSADRLVSFIAIELLNGWGRFARSFYLSCVMQARRECGQRVRYNKLVCAPILGPHDALTIAVRKMKPNFNKPTHNIGPRDEPAWHPAHTLLELAKHLDFSNLPEIAAAFSYAPHTIPNLTKVRNFFAHRNRETFVDALSLAKYYNVVSPLSISGLILARAPGRPQIILEDWFDEIDGILDLICR